MSHSSSPSFPSPNPPNPSASASPPASSSPPSSSMSKYFSIGHFAPFLQHARFKYSHVDEFSLVSSIKIHGAHLDLVMTYAADPLQNQFHIQSRNNIIDIKSNMHGAVTFVIDRIAIIDQFFQAIGRKLKQPQQKIVIACEFAGSNIQKNVAFTQVEKCLILLGVQIDDEWIPADQWPAVLSMPSDEKRIYHIMDSRLPKYDFTLNMKDTGTAQTSLANVVDQVETQCPFARNILGVNGIGEGLVFHAKGYESDPQMYFKVKGAKHTENKVKTLRPLTQDQIEKMRNLETFVDSIVPERRLEQGVEYMYEQQMDVKDRKLIGEYIKWVTNDVNKECMDDIKNFGLDAKKVQRKVAERAKTYFLSVIHDL